MSGTDTQLEKWLKTFNFYVTGEADAFEILSCTSSQWLGIQLSKMLPGSAFTPPLNIL